jgi:energy-coupling factor transporter transmembrane protein EcfT
MNSSDGMFVSLLTLIFVTLKLIGKIDWSWWWVLSPIWIPLVIAIVLFLIYLTLK